MRASLTPAAAILASLAILAVVACGSSSSNNDTPTTSECGGFTCAGNEASTPCVGLQCQQTTCTGGAKTTLSGTVLDPAGKVPIFNATVYIPNADLDPIPDGASCDRCDAQVSGKPVVVTATDTSGHFSLENVPVGPNIPLVVQIGKWRRKVVVSNVASCVDTPLDPTQTRLPRNRTEGDIPRIAVTTGGADPLQCLLRKIGLDDSEFGIAGSDARVHLYAGSGYNDGTQHDPSTAMGASLGGASFPAAEPFWSDTTHLAPYDVVLLSCEGGENETAPNASKPAAAKQAMYDYAKAGGRIFASHYHYVWFSKSPDASVANVATWAVPEATPPAVPSPPATTAVNTDISAAFPKVQAMNDWLSRQSALTADGKLPVFDARDNVDAVSSSALSWISVANANNANKTAVEYMTFNAPVGADDSAVCGRVVVSDIHVAAGNQGGVSDDPSAPFPDGCRTTDLSAQQKALEFMLFDLSSCAQKDDGAIVAPH